MVHQISMRHCSSKVVLYPEFIEVPRDIPICLKNVDSGLIGIMIESEI
jgi:hypothetical protein